MPSLSLSPYLYEKRYFALTKLELQKKDIVPTLETISLKRLRTLLQLEYELLSNDCAVASSAG